MTTWIHIWRKHVVWFLHFEFGIVLRVNFDRAKICTHEYIEIKFGLMLILNHITTSFAILAYSLESPDQLDEFVC